MNHKGWKLASVIAGIALGTWAVTRYVPPPSGTEVGQRMPEFRTLSLAKGDTVELRSAYAGHVTLVNLWATYCGPCIKEMPSMERLYQSFKARGLRIAGVSLDDGSSEPVLAFAQKLGVTFDILQDRSNLSLQVFQGMGLPYSMLIDTRGVVRYVALGKEEWDSAENMARVEALLEPVK